MNSSEAHGEELDLVLRRYREMPLADIEELIDETERKLSVLKALRTSKRVKATTPVQRPRELTPVKVADARNRIVRFLDACGPASTSQLACNLQLSGDVIRAALDGCDQVFRDGEAGPWALLER